MRELVLGRDPVCTECRRRASTTVDHIVPKAEGGDDSAANLRALCEGCHKRKTGQDSARRKALKRMSETIRRRAGWPRP